MLTINDTAPTEALGMAKSTGQSATTNPRPPRVSRAQRNREIQDAITASALELLAGKGVDGLGLTKIAAHAGMSNGPLYGRYDSAEDVALELWETQLRDHYRSLLRDFETFINSPGTEPSEELLEELTNPSVLTSGAVEIIAVARRFPLLVDTVRSDIEATFHELQRANPGLDPSLCALLLLFPTGSVLASRWVPESHPPWRPVLLRLRRSMLDPAHQTRSSLDPAPRLVGLPIPDVGDAGFDEFVTAVMEVVARVGFERTTTHRVARAAGRSFSSAYAHVGTKDELMHRAIGQMIDQIWTTGIASIATRTPEDYVTSLVALQRGLFAPGNRAIRQLRTETLIAMRHHPDLASAGRAQTTASVARIPQEFGLNDPVSIEAAASLWYLASATGMGTAALSLLTTVFDEIDWTPMASVAQQMAQEHPGPTPTEPEML